MVTYQEHLNMILSAAQDIASREFQEEAWFPGGKFKSSPDEIYQMLMEGGRPDSFFEEYAKTFTTSQMLSWHELRSQFESYYDKMPLHADPRSVLDDPEWDLVRKAAQRFVQALSSAAAEPPTP
jgi:hypothetical protein